MKTCSPRAFLLSFLLVESVHATAWAQSKVTCVGDSITAGDGSTSYPSLLQGLFGSNASVQNAGYSGATMLSSGDLPYATTSAYGTSTAFVAQGGDVVVQLGTNDSTSRNWTSSAAFIQDCKELVHHYQSTSPSTRVWLNLVPPAFEGACCKIDGTVIRNEIIPALQTCASETGVSSIDVFSALDGHPEYFTDGAHPNAQGAGAIARIVHGRLSQLPDVTLSSSGPSAAEGGAISLAAGPRAAYGAIEKVRFYEGTTLLAEVTNAPWTLLLNGLTRGTHAYRAEAVETGGRMAESRPITIKVTESAPTSNDGPAAVPDDAGASGPSPSASDSAPSATSSSKANAFVDGEANAHSPSSADSGCSVGSHRSSWASALAVSALMIMLHARRRRRACDVA